MLTLAKAKCVARACVWTVFHAVVFSSGKYCVVNFKYLPVCHSLWQTLAHCLEWMQDIYFKWHRHAWLLALKNYELLLFELFFFLTVTVIWGTELQRLCSDSLHCSLTLPDFCLICFFWSVFFFFFVCSAFEAKSQRQPSEKRINNVISPDGIQKALVK